MSKRIKKRKSKASESKEEPVQQPSKDQLQDQATFNHLLPENIEKAKLVNQSKGSPFNFIVIIGFSLAIVLGLILTGAFTGELSIGNNDGNDNQNNFIPTNTDGAVFNDITTICINQDHSGLQRHDNIEINVIVLGNNFPFPNRVGIGDNCMNVMHTHQTGNAVHIEVPNSWGGRQPNMGDFFTIYGQQFSDTNLMGTEGNLTMSINGVFRAYDFAGYQPVSGNIIILTLT